MSYENTLLDLIGPLLGQRFYPDVPPDPATYPCGVYQQVGGQGLWFSERTMPSHKHARVQITIWADTRQEANQLIRQIEDLTCTLANAETYGGAICAYEETTKKFRARQDFGLWHSDP